MKQLKITREDIEKTLADIRTTLEGMKVVSGDFSIKIPAVKSTTLKPEEMAQVHFSQVAWYKQLALIEECGEEIGWDGIIRRDPENPRSFIVEDILIFPQIVSGATVETEDEPWNTWLNSLDDATFNARRYNGHSHVNMGCTPSGTDRTYREQSITNVEDFFVYGIFNKRGEHTMEIVDVENNVVYENIDIVVYKPVPSYKEWAKEAIKDNLKKRTYSTGTNYNSNYNSNYGNYGNYNNTNANKPLTTPVIPPRTTPAANTTAAGNAVANAVNKQTEYEEMMAEADKNLALYEKLYSEGE